MGDIFNKLHTHMQIELFRSFLNCWYFFFCKTISLPDPYESNCLDKNESKVPGYKTYTILGCLLMCQTKYIIEKCGCRDVGMPGE